MTIGQKIPVHPLVRDADFGKRTFRGHMKTEIFGGLLGGRETDIIHEKGRQSGPRAGCDRKTI